MEREYLPSSDTLTEFSVGFHLCSCTVAGSGWIYNGLETNLRQLCYMCKCKTYRIKVFA